jgi:hypothetical protein
VRDLRPDVPDELAAVLSTMLAKRPDDRFQNPAELSAALLRSMEQIGVAAPAVAVPVYRFRRFTTASWWRRHATWLVPTVLLLLSVLILGVMWNREAATATFPEPQIPDTMAPADNGVSESNSIQSADPSDGANAGGISQ